MIIAILSDIHSNEEALRSTLESIDALGISTVYCLGDVVGYGAGPNECVALLRERNIPCIAGNHDKAAVGELSINDFSAMAKEAIQWTRSVLTEENKRFLGDLGYQIETQEALYVHSSPDHPEDFRYLLSYGHAIESFGQLSAKLCFIGHTHRPVVFCEDGVTQRISRDKKFIVNAGSVGQPRDGDRRGCFSVFDTELYSVDFVRVEYDIEKARKKIIDAGLPQKLGDRLLLGI